jgi:UDP-glucose 4-epimerase
LSNISGRAPVVLVVGGTSFIAMHLLPKLVASGATVFATRRQRGGEVPGVQWVPNDLAAADSVAAWPSRCDAIFYLAQSRDWRRFPEGAADVFSVNIESVFRALEYSRRAGVTHFVFASSGSIYPAGNEPAREGSAIDIRSPRTFYSASKLAAELLIGPYREFFTTVVLRLFAPFGPGQAAEMLLPRVADAVRSGRPVTLDGESGLRINPIAVSDVADGLHRCLSLDAAATLNLAGREVVTLREVAERIGRIVGREPVFDVKPRPSPVIVGDITDLRARLSWAPALGFDDGLKLWLGAA